MYLLTISSLSPGQPEVTFGEFILTSERLNVVPQTFNVTCTSTNGPVTSVEWMYRANTAESTFGPILDEFNPITTQTVDDTETGAYTLTLSVTGILFGYIRCDVTSARPTQDPSSVTVSAEDRSPGKTCDTIK